VVWETPFETAGDIHDSQSDFSVRQPYPFKLNNPLKKKIPRNHPNFFLSSMMRSRSSTAALFSMVRPPHSKPKSWTPSISHPKL
jgi:hypothetical protein